MSPELQEAIVTYVIGPVVVIFAGFIVARNTGRAAKQAEVDEEEVTATSDASDRSDAEKDRHIERLQTTVDGLITTVGHLAERVDTMEEEARVNRDFQNAATGYIRRLLDFIHVHLPDHREQVPNPPAMLADRIDP